MARALGLIAVAASSAALTGCAGTTLLANRDHAGQTSSRATSTAPATSTGTPTTSPEAEAYLQSLSREQAKLAAAERAIPRRARTPAALARSIRLLQRAIVQLAGDLQAITPPGQVAPAHAQLVSIVRAYAVALGAAARLAVRPGGELRAANMLISATTTASQAFSSTVTQINAALGH
jgi:hypothetical protein